jgi:hypothetical protein
MRVRRGEDMKKIRAYFLFFLVIVLLSSLGVAAEKAVRSVKVEFAMGHSVPEEEMAAIVDQGLRPGGIKHER